MDIQNPATLESQVRGLLAEVFALPIEEIPAGLAFGDIPEWDSLGHMDLIMLLEERYGLEVDAGTIAGLTSIPAICARIGGENHA